MVVVCFIDQILLLIQLYVDFMNQNDDNLNYVVSFYYLNLYQGLYCPYCLYFLNCYYYSKYLIIYITLPDFLNQLIFFVYHHPLHQYLITIISQFNQIDAYYVLVLVTLRVVPYFLIMEVDSSYCQKVNLMQNLNSNVDFGIIMDFDVVEFELEVDQCCFCRLSQSCKDWKWN